VWFVVFLVCMRFKHAGYTIPQTAFLFLSTLSSLFFGGSLAHRLLRPDLTLPLPPRRPDVPS
jgi:hypothetical protein